MRTQEKLGKLRERMKLQNIDIYLVGNNDPHQGEYVAGHYLSRSWLSGFCGSAGLVAVAQQTAGLWTDSRYFLEAEAALDGSGIDLYKEGLPEVPTLSAWILEKCPGGGTVAFDEAGFSWEAILRLEEELEFSGVRLEGVGDLLAEIWTDRPGLPDNKITAYRHPWVKKSRKEKIESLNQWLAAKKSQWILLSGLDEIAWLLNLRGSDIDYNPFFYSFLLVGPRGVSLFVDQEKLDKTVREKLFEDGISLAPYGSLDAYIQTLSSEDILVLPPKTSAVARVKASAHMRQLKAESPVALWKAKKDEAEIEALRSCLVKDGVALVKAFREVETRVAGGESLSEVGVGEILARFRSQEEGYLGESFPPIVGFREHGAVVHYRAAEESDFALKGRGLLLVDSGGQYQDGTSDLTRVLSLGAADEEEKEFYTLVLKAHIALALSRFPQGTGGHQLDSLARAPLWKRGLNYGHGTGHGIGFAMSVHEGPCRISPKAAPVSLEPGMVLSNEPGYYIEGKFGLRIENVVVVKNDPEVTGFLCFETLSLCPFEPALIVTDSLSEEELAWLEAYNARARETLGSRLGEEDRAWLEKKTTLI